MTESELKTWTDANAEFMRLLEVETSLRIRVALEAELVAQLYPNDERLKYLRDAVARFMEARKETLSHMGTDLQQALLPFGHDISKVQTND